MKMSEEEEGSIIGWVEGGREGREKETSLLINKDATNGATMQEICLPQFVSKFHYR